MGRKQTSKRGPFGFGPAEKKLTRHRPVQYTAAPATPAWNLMQIADVPNGAQSAMKNQRGIREQRDPRAVQVRRRLAYSRGNDLRAVKRNDTPVSDCHRHQAELYCALAKSSERIFICKSFRAPPHECSLIPTLRSMHGKLSALRDIA